MVLKEVVMKWIEKKARHAHICDYWGIKSPILNIIFSVFHIPRLSFEVFAIHCSYILLCSTMSRESEAPVSRYLGNCVRRAEMRQKSGVAGQ